MIENEAQLQYSIERLARMYRMVDLMDTTQARAVALGRVRVGLGIPVNDAIEWPTK